MRVRPSRTLAAIGATALALTACSGGGGGTPEEDVAAGLSSRLEGGAAFTLTVDGDLDALSDGTDEAPPPEVESLLADGLVRGAFDPDGRFALTLGPGDGFFQLLTAEQALYLRVDLDGLAALSDDPAAEMPDRAELQAQLDQLNLPDDIAALAQTALDGGWIGVTGLSQESLESLAEDFGAPTGDGTDDEQDQVRGLLEERGLLDGDEFADRYLTIDGDGPTYDVTIRARALVEAITEILREVQSSLGAAAMVAPEGELPDPADVPEEVQGFTMTVEDGTLTRVTGDLGAIAQSAGEDTGDLQPGDLSVVLELADVGDQLDVPADAHTISFDQLLQAAMTAMFSGGLGGLDLSGGAPDLQDLEELQDAEDLEDLEELLSELPTPTG